MWPTVCPGVKRALKCKLPNVTESLWVKGLQTREQRCHLAKSSFLRSDVPAHFNSRPFSAPEASARSRAHTHTEDPLWSRPFQKLTKATKWEMGDSVPQHATQDLLCQARNVISRVSINSARVVKLFQAFVATAVIPANRARVKLWQRDENRNADVRCGRWFDSL